MQHAIYAGQLTIEPVPSNRLTQDPTLASSILGPSTLQDLTCALCGGHIFPRQANDGSRGRRTLHQASASWASTSRFLKAQAGLISSSVPASPISPGALPPGVPTQTYVFRVSLPPAPNQKPSTTYPLCHAGFCLSRLRSTCELWHLVRDIIGQVWSEPRATPAPPLHPRSAARSLSYSSIIGRPATPNAADPNQRSNGTSATSRQSVAGRVGNLWASGLGALSASSRASSPAPEPISDVPKVAAPEPAAPPVPPRRLPPIWTDTAGRSPHPPPLPHRRHPSSSTKPKAEAGSEVNGHVALEDTSTLRSNGTREESGLLTPASESDGFKTPPDRELESPVAEETDTIYAKALTTELPPSRPTSMIVDVTIADTDELATPKPSATDSPATVSPSVETPRAEQPPSPAVEALAVPAPGPPPPLPRRAAARGTATPSRAGSPAAPTAEPAVAPTISQSPEKEGLQLDVQENVAAESVTSPVAELDPKGGDAAPALLRSERAFSITSASSQYSSEVNDVVRKGIPTKPPTLPPRRSQSNMVNGGSLPHVLATNAMDEPHLDTSTFTDGVSWEEKTWKGLVHLRENMFWARMGATRGSEDVSQAS